MTMIVKKRLTPRAVAKLSFGASLLPEVRLPSGGSMPTIQPGVLPVLRRPGASRTPPPNSAAACRDAGGKVLPDGGCLSPADVAAAVRSCADAGGTVNWSTAQCVVPDSGCSSNSDCSSNEECKNTVCVTKGNASAVKPWMYLAGGAVVLGIAWFYKRGREQ